MSEASHFFIAVVWGSLAGQFLVEMIASAIGLVMLIFVLAFSPVSRRLNFVGSIGIFSQLVFSALLFVGGNWGALMLQFGAGYPDRA
jgi:hypothetical protein